jgi:lysophospholipase L1-like esterase
MPAQLLTVSDIGTLIDPAGTAAADVAAHAALTTAHGSTSANTASRIVQRSAAGVTSLSGLQLDTAAAPTAATGLIRWNDVDKTAEIVTEGGVTLQLGQEETVYVRNASGVALANGDAVYVTGATGQRPTVAKATANSSTAQKMIGLVTTSGGIANNAFGFVTVAGIVRDLDTSAFTDGAELWLSPTVAGALTATQPSSAAQRIMRVGYVLRVHANQGQILVATHYHGTPLANALMESEGAAAGRTALGAASASDLAAETARATAAEASYTELKNHGVEQWLKNIKARRDAKQTINVVCIGDSKLAGAGGSNPLDSVRNRLQLQFGDGGIGWQPLSVWSEYGFSVIGFNGYPWAGFDQNTVGSPVGSQLYCPGLAGIEISTNGAIVDYLPNGYVRAVDKVDLYYVKQADGGTFSAGFNGGATTSGISSVNATPILAKVELVATYLVDPVQQYLRIVNTTGHLALAGVVIKRGTGGLRLHRLALGGSTTGQWSDLDATAQTSLLTDLLPDLLIIELGQNGTGDGANKVADIQIIIDRAKAANPDVAVLIIASTALADDARAIYPALAATNGAMYLDERRIVGTPAEGLAAGLMFDGVHLSALGNELKAAVILGLLKVPEIGRSGATAYGDKAPPLDVDATSVGGYKPGDGLDEDEIRARTGLLNLTPIYNNPLQMNLGGASGFWRIVKDAVFIMDSLLNASTEVCEINFYKSGVGFKPVDYVSSQLKNFGYDVLTTNSMVRLKSYTVATLPAGTQGDTAYVTDATSPTYRGALVGGGAVVVPVFHNGAAWVSC